MANEVDLRPVPDDELFGEIRRRHINKHTLRDALSIDEPRRVMLSSLRDRALLVLGGLTLVLVVIVGILAVREQQIPDLFTGLVGTGLGAIAGIFSGGSGGGSRPTPPAD